jgi:negative regulator of replication initiation
MKDNTNEEISEMFTDIRKKVLKFSARTQTKYAKYVTPQIDLCAVYEDFPDPENFKAKVLAMIEDDILLFSVDFKNRKKVFDALIDIYDPNTDYDYIFLSECPCGYIDEKASVYLSELSKKLEAMEKAEWEYLNKYWEEREF